MSIISGSVWLDWAMLAVSLFNTVLLLWLGLTVVLNADRRTWGIWLAGGGLLLGAAFFVSHTAILGRGVWDLGAGLNFWWHVGWVPVVTLPFAWYLVMLWYAGYWDGPGRLRHRHRPWFFAAGLMAVGLAGLLLVANPLPAAWQVARLDLSASPSVAGVSLLLLLYPPYVVLCIALALDVLLHPERPARWMGDAARRRARPWLLGASASLLLVSLLVAALVGWLAAQGVRMRHTGPWGPAGGASWLVAWFDLAVASLIGGSVLLLGQALVSYEVFTGKALPRRGLVRHWRRAVLLAAGYGLLVAGSLVWHVRNVYALLLTALLMTLFYALLSWRSFAERERAMEQLRPFVSSPRLYDHLLAGQSGPPELDVEHIFRALADLLGASSAYLLPLGSLRPLAGPPLALPPGSPPPVLPADLAADLARPGTFALPLDGTPGGGLWAVPLWSERGLAGALLLGPKRDGGLYTQEEIEIARASGERLADTLASAEMARRLMALQRQRLAESRVLDQKARRVLHDEVLPLLHTALLTVRAAAGARPGGGNGGDLEEAAATLAETHRQVSDLLRELPGAAAATLARLGLPGALRAAVEAELRPVFDRVTWSVEPAAESLSGSLSPLCAEVLFYAAREAARNAARHGRDPRRPDPFHLDICLRLGPAGDLEVVVEDNGVGLPAALSHPDEGGPGQGLALHSTLLAVMGGTLAVDSVPGAYTRVTLSLPGD